MFFVKLQRYFVDDVTYQHAEYGEHGVLALLSDSTNAERPGFTATAQKVGASMEALFSRAGKKRASMIEDRPVANMTDALQGAAPNVVIQQRSSNPNDRKTNFNIRGITTVNDNSALFVIDAFF